MILQMAQRRRGLVSPLRSPMLEKLQRRPRYKYVAALAAHEMHDPCTVSLGRCNPICLMHANSVFNVQWKSGDIELAERSEVNVIAMAVASI